MHSMPLKKVKLLGGKLGEEITKKWGFSTAGEAQALPLSALMGCFGERLGNYVWHAVRGIQADKVQEKQAAKSMLAAKTFQSTKELSDIRKWLGILAEELSVRMLRDFDQNHRHPRLLQLYYRCGEFRQSREHTKSWSMPHAALCLLSSGPVPSHQALEVSNQDSRPGDEHGYTMDTIGEEESIPLEQEQHKAEDGRHLDEDARESKELLGLVVTDKSRSLARVLEESAYNTFKRLEKAFPCSRLALAAGGFQDLPAPGTKSIEHFFSSVARGNQNSSPMQSFQGTVPKETNSPNKGKVKPKGMLRFFTHETTPVLQDGRHRDTDGTMDACEDSHTLQAERGGHKLGPANDITGADSLYTSGLATDLNGSPAREPSTRVLDPGIPGTHDEEGDDHQEVNAFENMEHSSTSFRPNEVDEQQNRSVDIGKVDVQEQLRILATIQRSNEQPLKLDGHSRGKRMRQPQSKDGQQSIAKFFRTQDKS